ncbi:MAG: hypothetical protein GC160_03705 [Acidobacteria bacterium]|nr:hypothetical protein [Acidobacteriota bacterium]
MRTLAFLFLAALPCVGQIDLRQAVILAPDELSKTAQAVSEEIEERTGLRWRVISANAALDVASIRLHVDPSVPGPEGYRIATNGGRIDIAGSDKRGALYGAGRFLRALDWAGGRVGLQAPLNVESKPAAQLRGHQLGYRPKTNSYDAFTVEMWEQYIRDLALWGSNAIELIPPRSDDDDDSPHFPLPKLPMMVEMSRILDEYDLDVWIWYPALDEDYSNPATVELALREWDEVFRALPRIDAVFVPGGDPGHTAPRYLMPLLEKQAAQLRKRHPGAEMWMAPQGFSSAWMEEFFGILDGEPAWLTGLVFGPQVRISLPELRQRTPQRYPIRRYPDITHSRHAQYPVPDWDLAYALTEGREVINPRPVDQANIYRLFDEYAVGFISYSEGVNDDVNKAVWSALGWDPDVEIVDALRDYARWNISAEHADALAQGILDLERNWRGPLLANEGVKQTLERFQGIERGASPRLLADWRFQSLLYRAYYDAAVHARLIAETAQEGRALDWLRAGAVEEAERELNAPAEVAPAWRTRVYELAAALFQSIRLQTSVSKYQAIATERGATLDSFEAPLNDRRYLLSEIAAIRALDSPEARQERIWSVLHRTDPGPGGFYDDLGNTSLQPHLVRGEGYRQDPAHLRSALMGFAWRNSKNDVRLAKAPRAWLDHAEAMNDGPLQMRYPGLDRKARYVVRVVYAGETVDPKIRLEAEGREVHGLMARPIPFRPLEFDIPAEATADGELTLTWTREPGLGGSGRGLQVSEVWLLKR